LSIPTEKSSWPKRARNSGYEMKFTINGIEVLQRRNKERKPCENKSNEYDQHLLGLHHQKIGCKAPYQYENMNPDMELCNTSNRMKAAQFPFNSEIVENFIPPCKTIQKLYYTYEDMELEGTIWDHPEDFWIGMYLPDTQYKEIIQSKYDAYLILTLTHIF
jgi:hypothetical protein